MFGYKRHVIFFFFGIIENLINFTASLFCYYPRVDLQFKYFDATQVKAAGNFLKELKNGKNIPKG
jgi:hypothetical protein